MQKIRGDHQVPRPKQTAHQCSKEFKDKKKEIIYYSWLKNVIYSSFFAASSFGVVASGFLKNYLNSFGATRFAALSATSNAAFIVASGTFAVSNAVNYIRGWGKKKALSSYLSKDKDEIGKLDLDSLNAFLLGYSAANSVLTQISSFYRPEGYEHPEAYYAGLAAFENERTHKDTAWLVTRVKCHQKAKLQAREQAIKNVQKNAREEVIKHKQEGGNYIGDIVPPLLKKKA